MLASRRAAATVLTLFTYGAPAVAAPAQRTAPEPSSDRHESPARRVVVVVSAASQSNLALLRAELQDLGLEVVEVSSDEAESAPESASPSLNAQDDFRIVLRPARVEVWIFDRATGRVTSREVFAQSDGAPFDLRTAVLYAVELLRWHLREREPKTRRASAAKPTAPPTPRARRASAEARSAWLFSLVPQTLYSPGGTSLGAGAEIDVAWRWSQFATRVFASTLLLPNQLVSGEGSARITPRFFGLQGVLLSSGDPSASGLGTSIGLGVALLSTDLRASATPGYQAHDDHGLTVSPILDLRAQHPISGSLAATLCGSVMTPLRSYSVRFGDREAGRYGSLMASLGLGLQINLR